MSLLYVKWKISCFILVKNPFCVSFITNIQLWFTTWLTNATFHKGGMHNVQHSQPMLEREVCELAHFFFFFTYVSTIRRTCNYNSPIHVLKDVFKIFPFHSNWWSNQPCHFGVKFLQTVYIIKEPIISMSIHVLNSI